MKLRINGFNNDINFSDDNVNILEIKDTKCFTHIIETINEIINGYESNEIFLLDDENNEINMSKEMYIALDLFNIDFNSKKILNKLYDKISENIEKMEDTNLNSMIINVRNYIIQEINELPFEFTIKDEPEITDLLKIYNLKIDILNYKTIIEKVEFLIDILATLKISNIIVIPNLKIYLSKEELVELYKYSLYNGIKLLLIEKNSGEKLKYEKILSINENFDDTYI